MLFLSPSVGMSRACMRKGRDFFSNSYSFTLAGGVLSLTAEVDLLRRIMWEGARRLRLQQNAAALARDDVKANATTPFCTDNMCVCLGVRG